MKKPKKLTIVKFKKEITRLLFLTFLGLTYAQSYGQIKLEKEVKITDQALHFDGEKVGRNTPNNGPAYDYFFGPRISAHGDCVKKFKNFIFTTWYKGGKGNRRVMLSRYNTETGKVMTIEFPHRHTGLKGNWWIGESHNTIAVGISPKNGTIHMLYDMHAYKNTGFSKNDYFRYAYSKENAATVPDSDFKLNLFIPDRTNDYSHVSLNGTPDPAQFQGLTYPRFFLNDDGDLLMHMRRGGNNNGAYVFSKYNAEISKWDKLTQFSRLNAKNSGQRFNWGPYGSMKYVNGKLRVGFQRRSSNNNDKYEYQNGFYYGYSDDQSGRSQWKDHKGKSIDIPFANADLLKVFEPGNLVSATGKNQVYIVQGFDWTVTDRGDIHIIGKVRDKKNNITKNVHTYKPAGSSEFITSTNFSGGDQLYTYGNNIYIIGIKNNRIYVEKADGGKNNFTRIYEPTEGKRFRHGVPYINDGKLYYYLMENKSGDKQPLYLQVIDLGIEDEENQPPTVSLINPSHDNQKFILGDTIALKANASDPDGNLDYVNFKINGSFYRRGFSVTWTPTKAGAYTIGARAFDKEGLSMQVSRTVIVKEETSNQPPTVSLTNPSQDNQEFVLGDTIALKADASDPDGNLDYINFKVNGSFYRRDGDRPFNVTWTPTKAGTYTIGARAFDKEGLSVEVSRTVIVKEETSNQPPIVSIANPSIQYQELELDETITLKANASDPDGNLDYVNFKVNDTFYKQDRNRPFAVTWEASKPGVYTIGVRAFDKEGLSTEVSRKIIVKNGITNNICSFQTPMNSGLSAMDKVTYSNVHVLGDNGPKLGNLNKFTINWEPDNNGLYQFAVNTGDGLPDWYIDFKDSMSFQLQNSNPEITLSNTGFDGLDGSYWVARDGANFALVSKSRGYTIYFSNSASAPNCNRSNPAIDVSQIKAFPNPLLDSFLTVTGMSEELKTLQVVSVEGRIVKEFTTEKETETMDVSELPTGSYFLVVKSAGFKESILVVKK